MASQEARDKFFGFSWMLTMEASQTPDTILVLPPLHQCPCCQKDLTDKSRSGVLNNKKRVT
jgi:hypothetical protein